MAVVTAFPAYNVSVVLFQDKELVFEVFGEFVKRQGAAPGGERSVAHNNSLSGIPVAKRIAAAGDGKHLVGSDHRSIAGQQHSGSLHLGGERTALTTAYTVGEHH